MPLTVLEDRRRRRDAVECPRCHATKVLRTSTGDGAVAFACSHCDHLWSEQLPAPPRVLIADDEEGIRLLVARALRTAGYEVTTASDGEEALAIAAKEGPFDVFLLDVRMPGLTGDEVASELRRRDPDSKILYFTGYADQLFLAKADLWEHEAFLEKPARPTALMEAVSLLLFGHIHGPGRTT